MGEFQFIYGMEWAHRLLGRITGIVFLGAPTAVYASFVCRLTCI